MSEELYRSSGCHYTTPISSHGVGEEDQGCFHVYSINVAHSFIENLYIKRLGHNILTRNWRKFSDAAHT